MVVNTIEVCCHVEINVVLAIYSETGDSFLECRVRLQDRDRFAVYNAVAIDLPSFHRRLWEQMAVAVGEVVEEKLGYGIELDGWAEKPSSLRREYAMLRSEERRV